jgi:phospholipase C
LSSRLFAFFLVLSSALILNACSTSSSNNPPPPQNFQLTVAVTGTGTVTSSPAGINCPTTCTASFPSGTSITLTATAGSGFQFGAYSGACSGASCQLVLSSNQSVSATFTSANSAQLTVAITGQGTVTSSPAGINCPSTCAASFSNGTDVTLTATASSGFNFSGFSGACSGMNCQVTISNGQNASVTATFAQVPHDITAINHIIIVTQENRSFDHYFGHLADYWQAHGFPQATNGTTFEGEPATASNPDPNGATVNAFNFQTGCTENPSPSWRESHRDRNLMNPTDSNNATMDGYVVTAAGDAFDSHGNPALYDVLGHRAMGYFTGDQLNYYYFMASTFSTSDNWFAPLMSRTQLNRMYLYAATSEGHVTPLPNGSAPLTSKTIFQLMQDNGISWKIYVHPDSSGCTTPSCLAKYSYLKQFTYNSFVLNNLPNQFASTTQLMSDIQNGTLPQVSFLEPAGYVGLDEHSNGTDILQAPSVQTGAKYISGIVNTLMSSPSWKDTVLILTYDEPGGFYDHVPPPQAVPPDSFQFPVDAPSPGACAGDTTDPVCGFFFTGFRVPLIVISPFTKANFVSHTPMDYTAMLKLIETRFRLPSLTARDAAQPDMTEFFDFAAVPWATPPSNVPTQDKSMQCVLGALSGITISPNPAPAGGQATVTLSLSKAAIQDMTVSLSADSAGVVPATAVIANATTSTTFNINVPTGITSLTITGAIGGIPVSGTVPVQ